MTEIEKHIDEKMEQGIFAIQVILGHEQYDRLHLSCTIGKDDECLTWFHGLPIVIGPFLGNRAIIMWSDNTVTVISGEEGDD